MFNFKNMDESNIAMNGYFMGSFPNIRSRSDLERCDRILAKQRGRVGKMTDYKDFKPAMIGKIEEIEQYLPVNFSFKNRLPFSVVLKNARTHIINFKEYCYDSWCNMVPSKELKRSVFDIVYNKIAELDGNGIGHGEFLFPFFFSGLVPVTGSNNGDFSYNDFPFDIKANGSASFKMSSEDVEQLLKWCYDKYHTEDVAPFIQLKEYVKFMPVFLLSKNYENALFLEPSDFVGIRTRKEMMDFLDNYQISYKDKKGEASHGLAIYFNYTK